MVVVAVEVACVTEPVVRVPKKTEEGETLQLREGGEYLAKTVSR